MELYEMTAHQLRDLLRKREVSAVEIVKSVLERIGQVEEKIKAYITITDDLALKQAEEVDRKLASGEELPDLAGIPVAIKDNICTKGVLTTCASKILYNFVPPYNATVMEKLNRQMIVMIGKTNMDEFAMGSSTENSGFFITRNPWDLDRVPGGSSGGSAAAIAADEAICALGSDTGGSIRQPAALCGVVGLKPTYGRVSRFGLVAFASSLDQIGPITKDVEDCALMMNAICGYDPMDSTSANVPVPDFTKSLIPDVKGIKIGVPKEYFIEGIDPEVEEAVKAGLKKFEEMGAMVEEISLPHTEYAVADYYIIASAEASANLERYDGVKYGFRAEGAEDLIDMYKKTRSQGFGPEVKRRIMLGTYALSAGYYDAYYLKGLKVRTLIKRDFDQAFEKVDVIVTPTSPTPAFRIGEKIDDPLTMYLSDIFTISVNLAGICAISIPCGFSSDGLPIGMQIIGKPFDEESIIRVAYAFEQNTDYHLRKPNI
ncbi:Asp-tRNA(Asn)/Glu-tRNA(Gln) amidotransferase GatCAB subunit A [Candidatus Poribacteria bacterium]|nr:MAG: Asp-tRNA(Asn)/Glu-tRNA(Gln) amidotransferase GatCAB subunit A [Candidatus Poribacteria bacterium]